MRTVLGAGIWGVLGHRWMFGLERQHTSERDVTGTQLAPRSGGSMHGQQAAGVLTLCVCLVVLCAGA